MGTRFVTTGECDAADAYKQAYLGARKEDIVIVKSPVGNAGESDTECFSGKSGIRGTVYDRMQTLH